MGMMAFLFDVDNTLTNTQREIMPRTQQALQQLSARGETIGVCTGRSYAELFGLVLPLFPSDALHVVSGGAQVVTSLGEVRWEHKLSSDFVSETVKQIEELGGNFVFGQGSTVYATPHEQDRKSQLDWKMQFSYPEDLDDWSTCLLSLSSIPDDFLAILKGRKDILVKSMVRSSGESYCDITPTGVTKATGVKVWAQLQGIELSQITGFGDSENDLEFFDAVGTSVALGNATADIKDTADIIIGHTNDEGLAEYLEDLSHSRLLGTK